MIPQGHRRTPTRQQHSIYALFEHIQPMHGWRCRWTRERTVCQYELLHSASSMLLGTKAEYTYSGPHTIERRANTYSALLAETTKIKKNVPRAQARRAFTAIVALPTRADATVNVAGRAQAE